MDWKNLIFSPLDLPEPPEIDMDEFISWHTDQKSYMLKHNQKSALFHNGKGY